MEIAKTIVKEEPGKVITGSYTAKELYYIAQLTEAAERIERMDEETLKQFREVIKLVKGIPEHRLRKQDPVQKMIMETIIRELKESQAIAQQAPVQQEPVKIVVELKVSQGVQE